MFNAGDSFEGKYIIGEKIGAGGFAIVYRAHQPNLKRDVAIKLVHPAKKLGVHPERLYQRFHREAQLLAELQNEQNVRLIDFGHSKEVDSLYMVMEFVDGTPLDKLIRRTGPMAPERVITILEQVLKALEEAHRLQILHRDVKPGNIIVFERLGDVDRAKLIDYGIAKPMRPENEGEGITAEGSIVGTPRYMAPEQIILVSALGPATDIYSLGLVAYEMLTGQALLGNSTHTEVLKRQLSAEVFYVPQEVPAPADLRQVINTMLVKAPRDRYQSAAEVITALRKCNVAGIPAASASDAYFHPAPATFDTQVDRPSTGEQHDPSQTQFPQSVQPHNPYAPPPNYPYNDPSGSGFPQTPYNQNPSGSGFPQTPFNQNPSGSGFPPAPHAQHQQQYPPQYAQHPQHPQQQYPQPYPQNPSGSGYPPQPQQLPPLQQEPPRSGIFSEPTASGNKILVIGVVAIVVLLGFLVFAAAPTGRISHLFGMMSCAEDDYEPNQRSLDGTLLTRGARIEAVACPSNPDWFFVGNRNEGDVVAVATEYTESAGGVTLELYVDSAYIARATPGKFGAIVSHRLKRRGAVSVVVKSQGEARDYAITLQTDQRNSPPR